MPLYGIPPIYPNVNSECDDEQVDFAIAYFWTNPFSDCKKDRRAILILLKLLNYIVYSGKCNAFYWRVTMHKWCISQL